MLFNWRWTLDFLGQRASFSPNHPVLYESDRQKNYTYHELNLRANNLVNYFIHQARLKKGDRVAVMARNCVEYFDLFFAAVRTGIILVPLNIRLSNAELSEMLRQTTPRLLAYEGIFEENVSALDQSSIEKLIVFREKKHQPELPADTLSSISSKSTANSTNNLTEIHPEDPLLILFTGGTTGPPKGAVLSHRSIFFNMLSEALSWQLGPKTIVPNLLPLFHTGGWNIVTLPTMYAGGQLLINPGFDPELILEQVEKFRCSFLFAAATMYRMISSLKNFAQADLTSLQFVMSGAAPCPVSVMEPYWEKEIIFTQGYGITEGGPNNLFMPWASLPPELIKEINQSVGKPFLYCQSKIVDEKGMAVNCDELGELLLSGPVTFSGYWNNLEESQKTLRDGWVHTGDIARQDDNGFYYIVDRKKDMYISGGENVFPVEVEKIIATHPEVMEAAVVGIPDDKWGESGKAYIVTKPGSNLQLEDIQNYLNDKLARYKIPRQVEFVDSIPKSGVGKVLKRMLIEDKE